MSAFRCTTASLDRSEQQAGTASTVRGYVLLHCGIRWGRDVLRDAPLPPRVRAQLESVARRGVKVLMLRRHGRAEALEGPRLFAAYAHPTTPWLEGTDLGDLDEVADLDLAAVAEGRSPGLSRLDDPLVCVCTHGRHDVCCAELGRPVAKALQESHPDLTWEVSHIGGDRFAGNLLVLPQGLYYGRVTPEVAPTIVAAHLDGQLDLEHLRGRSCQPTSVQAADWFLRRQLDETRLDAFVLTGRRRAGDIVTVELRRGSETWQVVVRNGRREAAQLTCRALRLNAAPTYELVSVTRSA